MWGHADQARDRRVLDRARWLGSLSEHQLSTLDSVGVSLNMSRV